METKEEIHKKLIESEWFKTRPEKVQEAILKYPPTNKYRIKGNVASGYIHSYSEQEDSVITITINLTENVILPRQVFGVNPEDLEIIEGG